MASCTSRLHGSASKKFLILWIKFLAFQWKLTWWCSSEMWLSNYTDNWHVTFFHVPQPAGSSAASPSSFFGYCDPTQQRQEEIHPHPHGKTSADAHGRRAVYTALPCCKVCVANLHSDDGKVASDPGVSHFRLYGRCFFCPRFGILRSMEVLEK